MRCEVILHCILYTLGETEGVLWDIQLVLFVFVSNVHYLHRFVACCLSWIGDSAAFDRHFQTNFVLRCSVPLLVKLCYFFLTY